MHNTILNYIIIGILLFFVLLVIALIDNYFRKKNEILQYEVDTRYTFNKPISKVLEDFIQECFDEYQLMVLIPKQELYINDDRQLEICKDLSNKVAKYISPRLLNTLYQWYNKDTIYEIIADKIYMIVANYVVQHNATIKSNP